MLHALSQVSWLGVAAAFVPYFLLGGLWFTALFPRPYWRSLGKIHDPTARPEAIFILGPAVCSLILTITTAVLMRALQVDTLGDGMAVGALVGFGYLVPNTVNIAINPNIPRPLLYGSISGAFHIAGILMVSAILVAVG